MDFLEWAAEYAYIKPKGGGEDKKFQINAPQRKLVAALEEMRKAHQPIRLILLKARQWGGSTCIQLYMAWLQLTKEKGLNSLIIAHQGCATDEIKDMFDRLIRYYDKELLYQDFEGTPPKRHLERVGTAGAAYRLVARNCKIKVGTAERPDSCRGGDYNLIHCSEVGLWRSTPRKSAEDIHRAACSGVLYSPDTMIVMESTANGTGNFFHREYMAAKEGKSQFKALFVAWYEIDNYSLPFKDDEEEQAFLDKLIAEKDCEQPRSDREQPGRYLWNLYQKGASLQALNWYVKERSKYSDHALMASEYPSDDIEAFVHSGARVFDKYAVEALRPGCGLVPRRGEIEGRMSSGPGSLEEVTFAVRSGGALQMWKDRETIPGGSIEGRYLVVVDVGGRTRSADWSVITVFDRSPRLHAKDVSPEVVAQWRGHTDHDLLAWNAARIARYYDNALLVIESNTLESATSGEPDTSTYILEQLRRAYTNLYARKGSPEDIRQGKPRKYGFHTNRSTKPAIIANLIKVIREGGYVERDNDCLDEYLTYEQRQDGSYAALQGCHDDLLMTRAIGLYISTFEMAAPRHTTPIPHSVYTTPGWL